MKVLVLEIAVLALVITTGALGLHEYSIHATPEPATPFQAAQLAVAKARSAKPLPLAMVLINQCDRPFGFSGVDTAGRIFWLDATTLDARQVMIVKQAVDQNHYTERTVPCIGHYKNQPPVDF